MKKTEKIYMVLQRKTRSLEEMKQDIIDWLSFLRIMTTIENYCFDNEEVQAFNLALITKRIQGCTEKEDLWIKIKGQGGESQLHISELTLHDRTILDKDLFFAYQTMIEDYLDTRMVKNGIYGYIRSLDEYLYNNVEMIEKRTFEMPEEIEKLPKRYNRNKEVIVDCNQLAGYDIFFKGLCLTSCWKMYYSDLFFRSSLNRFF